MNLKFNERLTLGNGRLFAALVYRREASILDSTNLTILLQGYILVGATPPVEGATARGPALRADQVAAVKGGGLAAPLEQLRRKLWVAAERLLAKPDVLRSCIGEVGYVQGSLTRQ